MRLHAFRVAKLLGLKKAQATGARNLMLLWFRGTASVKQDVFVRALGNRIPAYGRT